MALGVLPELARSPTEECQVAPCDLRPDCISVAAPITRVLFPQYAPDARLRLEPISRGVALIEATKHTFAFRECARVNLDVLAAVVRDAECFTLTVGDLDTAVDAVMELVGVRSGVDDR
jgi:hypothetical protein